MELTRRRFIQATTVGGTVALASISRGPKRRCASSRSRAPPRPAASARTAPSSMRGHHPHARRPGEERDGRRSSTSRAIPTSPINARHALPEGHHAQGRHHATRTGLTKPQVRRAGLGQVGGHLLGRGDRQDRAARQDDARHVLRRKERQGPGRQPQSRHRDDRRLHRYERVQLPPVEGHHGPGGAVPGHPGTGLTRPHGGQFGRHVRPGAMTNGWVDIKNADVILAMGGNPAENHPVGFKWFIEARKTRGAKIVAVDPRFTRTGGGRRPLRSRSAPGRTSRLPARASSATRSRTSASTRTTSSSTRTPRYLDRRDVRLQRGPLLRFRRGRRRLRQATRGAYQLDEKANGQESIRRLQNPRCVLPAPEGARRPLHARDGRADLRHAEGRRSSKVAEIVTSTGNAERVGTITYALGWTQHSTGVQIDPRRRDAPAPARATSGGPAAASTRSAATPTSRARPTWRARSRSCRAISRRRAAPAGITH